MSEKIKDATLNSQDDSMEEVSFAAGLAAAGAVSTANQDTDEDLSSVAELVGGRGEVGRRALRQVFSRLEKVLGDEMSQLHEGRTDGLDEIAQRKSQCLLDLARLSRALNIDALAADNEGESFKEEVARIKAKLSENEATLKFYLEAAREVATMVAESVRMADSDGTYSESGPFGRYGR
ncbi:hypothetical protein [Pseudochelatococcus sp. G4_1912]|uniref:hypothetical protein n=1 Tax=Pseudochelatococcus sp. G4_1912 TaxID=3114288 RepID=UPI0039C5C585